MKAILADKSSADGLNYDIQQKIFSANDVEFVMEDCKSEDEVIQKCKDADALLVIYQKITPKIMDALKKCKVILRYGIGYDVIDVEAATERNIKICNSPTHCLDEVATHAIAMLLALERNLIPYNESVKDGKWLANCISKPHRLSAQTLGFIGFGNIARRASDFAKGFGFNMIAYDPYLLDEVFERKGVKRVTLDELYSMSDAISIHTPLFDNTYHLINKESISKMKDNVMIVNTARGAIICENDLLEAVESRKVSAAALDVIESEPITEKNHPVFKTGRIIVSPHAAYNSVEAEEEMMRVLADTAVSILNGNVTKNIVNAKQLGL